MENSVFAYFKSFDRLDVYRSRSEAAKNCEGLDVAEGDYLFFDAKGFPLEAVFSKPAYIDTDRSVYGNGAYALQDGSGETLLEILIELCHRKGHVHLYSTDEMNRLYEPDVP